MSVRLRNSEGLFPDLPVGGLWRATVAIALLVLSPGSVAADDRPSASPPPVPTQARLDPPRREQVEAALARTRAYFTARGTSVAEEAAVTKLIDILGRHFRYPLTTLARSEYIEANPELKQTYFRAYDTAYDNKNTIEAFPPREVWRYFKSKFDEIDTRTAWSMYCRQFPLPDDFVPRLHEFADRGEYELTHVALQYGSARHNRCLDGSSASERELEAKLAVGLQAIAAEAPPKTPDNDIRLEAMAMLYYIGRPELMRPEWLRWILDEQRADGGWAGESGTEFSWAHATILAAWTLLEYRSRLAGE